MTYPQVQFVSSPDESAVVRFDFNDAGEWADEAVWPLHAGWSLGAPSLLGDPDGIGAQDGFRNLVFNIVIESTPVTAAARVSALARELRRDTNWLLFKFSERSEPVWFKTYRSAPSALDFEQVLGTDDSAPNRWGVGINLDADPLAYGAQQTIGPVTVSNDPEYWTNPNNCKYALPAILGDAPAKLEVDVVPSVNFRSSQVMLGVTTPSQQPTPGGVEYPRFLVVGSAASTVTTGNGSITNMTGVIYSGGSATRIDFDVAASTLLPRFDVVSNMPVGRSRVMVRVSADNATSVFRVGVRFADGSVTETVTVARTSAGFAWVDLGVVNLPLGAPAELAPEILLATPNAPIYVAAARDSGTGKLIIDAIAMIPIDLAQDSEATTLWTEFTDQGLYFWPTDAHVSFDAESETVTMFTVDSGTGARTYTAFPLVSRGGLPEAWPGRDNTLVLFQQTGDPGVTEDDISRSAVVTIRYRPRFLYLAPSVSA